MNLEILSISAANAALIGTGSVVGLAAAAFGLRRLIQMGQFSYHNARLSTAGNPYVRRENLTPLTEMGSPSEIAKSLLGPIRIKDSVSNFKDVDASLIGTFNSEMSSLSEGSPSIVRPLISSFIARYESEELKRVLRSVGKREEPLFPVGSIDGDLEKAILSSADLKSSLEHLENHPAGEYITESMNGEDLSLLGLDKALDRYALGKMADVKELPRYCRKGARAISDLIHDRYNLGVIIQSKAMNVDREIIISSVKRNAGTIGSGALDQMIDSADVKEAVNVLSATHVEPFIKEQAKRGVTQIEIGLDRMLLTGAIGLSTSYYGNVGPTIRYVIGKEMELKNLRMVFRAAYSDWDPSRTRDLLILEEEIT